MLTACGYRAPAMGFLTDAQKNAAQGARRRRFRLRHSLRAFSHQRRPPAQAASMLVFRIINTKVRTMDELGLPEQLKVLTQYHNGLVLVTGAVGCGKSTTLAAMVAGGQHAPARSHHHAGRPDRIRLRTRRAARSPSARSIPTPILRRRAARQPARRSRCDHGGRNARPGNDQPRHHRFGNRPPGHRHAPHQQRRAHARPRPRRLPGRAAGPDPHHGQRIAARHHQPAARSAPDGNGRVIALEIMVNTPAVANLIREAKTFMLPGIIQTGKKLGMKLMDDSLLELYDDGLISQEEAYARAEQKALMRATFRHAA